MKQVTTMALSALLLASCQDVPKGYVINGVVENMSDGPMLTPLPIRTARSGQANI